MINYVCSHLCSELVYCQRGRNLEAKGTQTASLLTGGLALAMIAYVMLITGIAEIVLMLSM